MNTTISVAMAAVGWLSLKISSALFPLDVEALDGIHDQVGWILSTLLHVQHLFEWSGRKEHDDLTAFAVNGVSLDVNCMVGLLR